MTDNQTWDDTDLSLIDLFRIELENHSRVLEAGLVEVEADPTPERMEPLMRAAHSIKGAARIVGLDGAVFLAHAMEDVLSAAQHGKMRLAPDHIDLLLRCNDLFVRLSEAETGEIPPLLQGFSESIKESGEALRKVLSGELPTKADETTTKGDTPRIESVTEKEMPVTGTDEKAIQSPLPQPSGNGGAQKTEVRRERSQEREEESFVRVYSENLNKLMGYAGECLVRARSTKPFFASLLKAKDMFREITNDLESVLYSIQGEAIPREAREKYGEIFQELEKIQELNALQIEEFEYFSRHFEHLADQLYDEVVATRMRPFSDGIYGFPRMVRDLARSLGKKISFQIRGESVKVDRDILERLEAPIAHLLRNAIDHGIETPHERQAAGKGPEGTLALEGRHSSGMLNIIVSDDGRGMDTEELRKKIVKKGHATEEMAVGLSREELLSFLFLPGFSTTSRVTEFSGRGVGLDVVLTMVQGTGGSVHVETEVGAGTSFHLVLPITLSVIRALIVEINGEPYAMPLARIDHLLEIAGEDLSVLEDTQFYMFENENIGVVKASQVLEMDSSDTDRGQLALVVISDRLNRYGIIVDRFLGQRDLVLIPLDSRLGKVPNINAGAILEDGSPVLILDVDDLVRTIDNLLTYGRLYKVEGRREGIDHAKKRVLVVDDSLTVREVERKLLESSGYDVTVAVDGVDGWNALQVGRFDLVVSDIDMPRMNGIELIRKIRAGMNTKDLPVIVVSYKDSQEDRIKGMEAGANYYLTKSSFHDEGLVNVVRDLIGGP